MEEPGLRSSMNQIHVCLAQPLAEEARSLNLNLRCLVNQRTKRIRTGTICEGTGVCVVTGQNINQPVQGHTQGNATESLQTVRDDNPNQACNIRRNRGTRTCSPQQSRENHNGKNDFDLVTGEAQNQQTKEAIYQTREVLITQPTSQVTVVSRYWSKTSKVSYRVEKNRRRVSKNNRTNMQTPSSNSPNQHCRSN